MPLWLLVLSLLFAACSDEVRPATQVLVVVESDLQIGGVLSSLRVSIQDEHGNDVSQPSPLMLATTEMSGRYTLPLSFGVVKRRADSVRVAVTGYGPLGQGGKELAIVEQKVEVSFQNERTLRVVMFLGQACLSNLCGGSADLLCYPRSVGQRKAGSCGPIVQATTEVVQPGAELTGLPRDDDAPDASQRGDGRVDRNDDDAGPGADSTPDASQRGDGRVDTNDDDAGPGADSTPDAGVIDNGPPRLMGPAAKLPGDYAILARHVGNDAANWFYEDHVLLGSIRVEGDRLLLGYEYCASRIQIASALLGASQGVMVRPDLLKRTHEVLVEGRSFRTTGDPLSMGFEPVSAASCPPGARISMPGRRWLPRGTCLCPAVDAPPPTLADDCRVTDPDEDGFAGQTTRYTGAYNGSVYWRMVDVSQFVQGEIADNQRHRAGLQRNVDVYQLACSVDPCPSSNVLSFNVCEASKNPVRFEPLAPRSSGQAWTCQDVLREVDAQGRFELDPASNPGC